MSVRIITGDCREVLPTLESASVNCCCTSPSYYKLRDYGNARQIGLEETPADYVAALVDVFEEVRRVLRPDGVLWLNLGDSYAGSWGAQSREHAGKHAPNVSAISANQVKAAQVRAGTGSLSRTSGLKPKDLIGIPWMVAFALRDAGWYLRQWHPWVKKNPMPESTGDRPTSACETIFMLTKSSDYFYDYEAVKKTMARSSEARLLQDIDNQVGSARANGGAKANGAMKAVGGLTGSPHGRHSLGEALPVVERRGDKRRGHGRRHAGFNDRWDAMERSEQRSSRAFRNNDLFYASLEPPFGAIGDDDGFLAFDMATRGFYGEFCRQCRRYFDGDDLAALRVETIEIDGKRERRRYCDCGSHEHWLSHFAVFPPNLIEPLIIAGCPPGGVVLDPFFGAGTTGLVADASQRHCIGIDVNPYYCEMARARIAKPGGMLCDVRIDSKHQSLSPVA